MHDIHSERGYAVLLVLLILLILSASIITVSAALRGQNNIADVSDGSTYGLKEAENAIAVAVSKMKISKNRDVFGNGFTLKQDGWTTDVTYDSTTNLLQAKASKDFGRFSRTVSVNVTSNMDTLKDYCIATDGAMTINNLYASLNGNKIYSRGQMQVGNDGSGFRIEGGSRNGQPGAIVTGQGSIQISTNGQTPSLGQEYNVQNSIPDVDWGALSGKTPAIPLTNPSATTLTNAIAHANDSHPGENVYIVVQTTGANPLVEITSMNFGTSVKVTLVILKDTGIQNAKPTFKISNGNINSTLNAFVQGDIQVSSGITNYGSFYATGRIDFLTGGGTYNLYGGLASKGGMNIRSALFGSNRQGWSDEDVFLPVIATTNWMER